MTGFSVDWLNLREAADQQARNSELLRVAAAFAASGGDAQTVVVDLGAGTGSTYRTFGQHGFSAEFNSTWRLVDNDRELLGEAARRADQNRRIETYELDLNHVAQLPLTAVRFLGVSRALLAAKVPCANRATTPTTIQFLIIIKKPLKIVRDVLTALHRRRPQHIAAARRSGVKSSRPNGV